MGQAGRDRIRAHHWPPGFVDTEIKWGTVNKLAALCRHQRLHPIKLSAQAILGLRKFLRGLPAQKIAVREPKQPTQTQVRLGADAVVVVVSVVVSSAMK